MKTVKLVLVAAFFSVSMMSYSGGETPQVSPGQNMALEVAVLSSDLLMVMFHQINEDLITGDSRGDYVARVSYNGQSLFIHGDVEEWQAYFIISKWVGLKGGGNNMPIKIDWYTY